MIPSAAEIASALYGTWRLAHLDASGLKYFDASLDGFWKSFFAAVLVAPAYVLIIVTDIAGAADAASAGVVRVFLVEALVYVILWTAFPLIMYHLAEQIDRSDQYKGFVVAQNWASVIQMLILLPVVLLSAGAFLPEALLAALSFAVSLLVLGYMWFITRCALNVSGAAAIGIVLLAVTIEYLVNGLGRSMIS